MWECFPGAGGRGQRTEDRGTKGTCFGAGCHILGLSARESWTKKEDGGQRSEVGQRGKGERVSVLRCFGMLPNEDSAMNRAVGRARLLKRACPWG